MFPVKVHSVAIAFSFQHIKSITTHTHNYRHSSWIETKLDMLSREGSWINHRIGTSGNREHQ